MGRRSAGARSPAPTPTPSSGPQTFSILHAASGKGPGRGWRGPRQGSGVRGEAREDKREDRVVSGGSPAHRLSRVVRCSEFPMFASGIDPFLGTGTPVHAA